VLYGAEMKKTSLALMLILMFSVLAGTRIISLTDANPNLIKGHYCNFSLQSPQDLMTYDAGTILLNFTAKTQWNMPPSYSYFYSLDEQDLQSSVEIKNVQIVGKENITDDTVKPYIETTLIGQAALSGLSNGPHSIRVFYGGYLGNGTIYAKLESSVTAEFIINTEAELPSPSPSLEPTLTPQPTPEQTPLPTINTGPSPHYYDFLIGGIAGAVAIAALVLLYYFTKRK